MIAEGSYPYIAGGVSSWINQIIMAFPDIDFKVVAIMPSKKETIEYKYEIPDNVINIRTIYLDDYLLIPHSPIVKQYKFNDKEEEELIKLMRSSSDLDWQFIINLIHNKKRVGSCIDFLQSKFFFNEVVNLYNETYSEEIFL